MYDYQKDKDVDDAILAKDKDFECISYSESESIDEKCRTNFQTRGGGKSQPAINTSLKLEIPLYM
jgi:hypothetical protein